MELNRAHLERLGGRPIIVPISSALRGVAFGRKDKALDAESGIPNLLDVLYEHVFERAKAEASLRARNEAAGALDQLIGGFQTELDLLGDASALNETLAALESTKTRLEHLRGPASRWSIVLGDRMGDLGSATNHRFRQSLRKVGRGIEETIEGLVKADEWAELSRQFQTDVAKAVADAFAYIDDEAADIQEEILGVLQEDAKDIAAMQTRARSVDPLDLWTDRPLEKVTGTKVGRGIGEAWGLVRGAQGGLITFGMLGQLLPAAAAALLMSNPIMLGFGVVFGRSVYKEQRRRKIAARQQQAQKAVRQYLDEVQFEVGNNVSETLRDMQRQLRDHFQTRMAELQRTTNETMQNLQGDAKQNAAGRETRTKELGIRLDALQRIRVVLGEWSPA